MSKYRKRATAVIEATRWFKNGDHPDDHVGEIVHDPWARHGQGDDYPRGEGLVVRYFRRPEPEFADDKIHDGCGHTWHDHGWIDDPTRGQPEAKIVCPGDYVVTDAHGRHWAVEPNHFEQAYVEATP